MLGKSPQNAHACPSRRQITTTRQQATLRAVVVVIVCQRQVLVCRLGHASNRPPVGLALSLIRQLPNVGTILCRCLDRIVDDKAYYWQRHAIATRSAIAGQEVQATQLHYRYVNEIPFAQREILDAARSESVACAQSKKSLRALNIKLHDRGRDWLNDVDIYGSRSGEFHSGLVEMADSWLEDDPEYLFGYLLRWLRVVFCMF